jgi:FMN reductase
MSQDDDHIVMTRTLKVVAVSGSLTHPSKTTALVEEIVATLGRALPIESHLIALHELGPSLAGALKRSQLPVEAEAELQRIESADVLIVASPVYRASFTGLFKHLFDFVDQYALVDTPVLLAASGGSERHALIIEHQFRPLFAFFQALTLPLGVYAHESDFTGRQISSARLLDRIAKAVSKAQPFILSRLAEREQIAWTLAGELPQDSTVDPRKPVRLAS